MNKALLYTRRSLAVLVLAAFVALFLDPSGQLRHLLGWLPKAQLLPAVLACNVVLVVAVLLVTFVVGRVYCAVVCPLGILQDVFSWLGGRFLKKRFRYRRPQNWVRYAVLAAFVLLVVLGFSGVAALIAPYAMFGRILSIGRVAGLVTVVGAVSLGVILVSAVLYGRMWCNTVCPVGSLLSLVSRFSLFAPRIDASKCVGCRKCEHGCKSSCINIDNHTVDTSRCVDCWHCLNNCRFGAIGLGLRRSAEAAPASGADTVDASRRKFLATTAVVGTALAVEAQEQKLDGGLAAIAGRQAPARQVPLKPFGARGLKSFSARCVGCQLCVSHCPEHVLRPSASLERFMQPEMNYSDGYCRMACTRCSEVCPAGAIERITPEEKTSISIGVAVTLHDNCLSARGVDCGACARHCPSGAIMMVPGPDGFSLPAVNESRCLGCGACEYYCPARPVGAIFVEGRERHAEIS